MDCLTARQTISEALDQGVVNTPSAALAREHCRTCKDCREFAEAVSRLSRAPRPKASEEVVSGIVGRASAMARATEEQSIVDAAEKAERPSVEPSGEDDTDRQIVAEPAASVTARPGWSRNQMVASLVGAAAVLLALVLTFQGFRALSSRDAGTAQDGSATMMRAAPEAGNPPAAESAPSTTWDLSAGTGASASADSSATRGVKGGIASAARFVTFGEVVYISMGARTPDAATLKHVGSITTALGSDAQATARPALSSSADNSVVFIETASGQYEAFQMVSRLLRGKRFGLAPGTVLDRFGVWPTLPQSYQAPTAPDGGPTFVPAGTDDSGQPVFAPVGIPADRGFAVAPGTSPSDPAASDPNWTWWQPLP